jgi:hypothetical protein
VRRREFVQAIGAGAVALPVGKAVAQGGKPVKQLEGLKYRPRHLTQPGCIEGCLEFLRLDVSPAWLWGASGIAFFTNVADDLCPSAMHSHKFNMNRLGCNVGYEWEQKWSWKGRDEYEARQREAWEQARRGIDHGHPSVLWEWEWVLVRGYDRTGYYLTGPVCVERDGPMPWEKLGEALGWMELVTIAPGTPKPDAEIVRAALQFAVGFWHDPSIGVTEYKGARAGYDTWLAALERQTNPPEAARTCAVYLEARHLAAQFLREAEARLERADAIFHEAIGHYTTAADSLASAAEVLPLLWEPDMDEDERKRAEDGMAANLADDARRERAIAGVTAARDAEEQGVAALEKVVAQL